MGCMWYNSIHLTLWKGKGSDVKWTSGYGGLQVRGGMTAKAHEWQLGVCKVFHILILVVVVYACTQIHRTEN